MITLHLQKLVYFIFVAAPKFTKSTFEALLLRVLLWLLYGKHSSIEHETWSDEERELWDWNRKRLKSAITECKERREARALLRRTIGERVRAEAGGNYPSLWEKCPRAALQPRTSFRVSPHALGWPPALL